MWPLALNVQDQLSQEKNPTPCPKIEPFVAEVKDPIPPCHCMGLYTGYNRFLKWKQIAITNENDYENDDYIKLKMTKAFDIFCDRFIRYSRCSSSLYPVHFTPYISYEYTRFVHFAAVLVIFCLKNVCENIRRDFRKLQTHNFYFWSRLIKKLDFFCIWGFTETISPLCYGDFFTKSTPDSIFFLYTCKYFISGLH
jgi:hypothetical protein